MSLYRITVISVNGNSSVPVYPNPLTLNVNEATLIWEYVAGNPPLPTSLSALEIVSVNINTGQTERVRLGAPSLTVGIIAGLQPNQTYDVQVVGYDVNDDPLAFSRPIRIVIPDSAAQNIVFFPILKIQRTLNYIDENYIQVTTNSPSQTIEIVWAGISGATVWRVWYGIASQGEYIDTNTPPRGTLSSTNITILPQHSARTALYVIKIKAYNNLNGNEIGTTRTYAFYWTIIVPDEPPPPPCSYQAYDVTAQQFITSSNHTISLIASASNRTIRIIASCPYSIEFRSNGWARLSNVFYQYEAAFDGNEDFPIYYDENTSTQSREATLIVRNTVNSTIFIITLRQAASSSAPPCNYNITTNPAYDSVRTSDNAYIVIVPANTTSIQVTVNTSSNCRYVFLDQFFQFTAINACALSPCSGTNTVTLSFTLNTTTTIIERTINIKNPDTNALIRRIVVRQLAPVTQYPFPDFVVPPTPYKDKVYFFDNNARYDIFVMHNGGNTIEISLSSDRRGVIANFGIKNFIKITVTKVSLIPAANEDFFHWRLRDTRNTQIVYKAHRFVCVAYNFPRAKFIAPTVREFFVPPSSGVSITFEWTPVNWADWYGLYMFSKNVLIANISLPSNFTTYTYNFTREQLESLENGELYVELLTRGYVTDQIVLRFENLPPPPPPPPPPPDETQIMDVIEHVFPNQILTSDDVAKEGFELRIWEIYGNDNAEVINRTVKTWLTEDGQELRVITEAPKIERTVSRSVLRSEAEFPSSTLRLTELFPFEQVFDRLVRGESKKQLMYYARLSLNRDGMVYSVAEGVIKLPVSTSVVKFKHTTNHGEVNQVKPFNIQLFHPAAILKFTNPIDQKSKSIQYNRTSNRLESSGKGVVDYVRNAFDAGILVKPIDVLDVIMTWLNEASIFAKAGIFDSVRDDSNNPYYYPTIEINGLSSAFALLRYEDQSLNVCRYVPQDLLFSFIYLESFIHSDSYGDPKTKQKSGELRDYSVQITRGLKGSDGKYPKEEKEYSLLGCQHVMEFVTKLTESCLANVSFVVRRVYNTYRVFMILSRDRFERYTYLYNRSNRTFQGAYISLKQPEFIENAYKKEVGAKIEFIESVRVSEVGGAGNTKEQDAVRTELNDLLAYDASKEDAVRAMFSAIKVEQRLSVASAYSPRCVFENSNPDKIERVLTLPSIRALEQHEKEFYVRTALQNIRMALPSITFHQTNDSFKVSVYVPTWYLLVDSNAFCVGRYLAEALYQKVMRRLKSSFQTISLRAKLENAIEFSEHYVMIAEVMSKQVMLRMLSCSYDVVRDEISGEFEVIDAQPFEIDYSLERQNEFAIRYDVSSSQRPRYTIPLRRAGFTYSSGNSIYGDSWKGYRLLWRVIEDYTSYSIIIYRYNNNILQFVHEVFLTTRSANTGNEFGLENYNFINFVAGRYLLVLQASFTNNNVNFVRENYIVLDVDYGFLNVNTTHALPFNVNDLANDGAVRIKFACAWFATKEQTIVILSSATSSMTIGEVLCVFIRNGFLHTGKFTFNKQNNTYSAFGNFSSLDLSKLPFGGGVHGKVEFEITINGFDVTYKANNVTYSSTLYAYNVDNFNEFELALLTNGHFFNVAERDGRYAKLHGEYIIIESGTNLSSMTKRFERYFDDEIGITFIENEKGIVFVDEGKNIAKF